MDYEEGRIDLNRELVASPLSTFLMRVRGDAMGPDGIRDGDLVVIDRSLNPCPGCVVVALLEGRFIVRRLGLGPGGGRQRPRLEASDGVSPPIPLNDGQGGGAELWGVVRHAVCLLEPRRPRSTRRRGRGISGDGKTEGGGHQPTAPQFPLELGRQAVGPPGPAQLGDQGQAAAEDDQAHQQPQAHFEHGLAD
jgi:DNA polymerase V